MRPRLELKAASIRGLRALRAFDLPGDLPETPGVLAVGGPSGSGKTTLLDFIAASADAVSKRSFPSALAPELDSSLDLLVSGSAGHERVRFAVGDEVFIASQRGRPFYGATRGSTTGPRITVKEHSELARALREAFPCAASAADHPNVTYLPSDRSLTMPPVAFRSAGKLSEDVTFFSRWARPRAWRDSTEAILYAARWEDLNALAQDPPAPAHLFDDLAALFARTTGGHKHLVWRRGELVVALGDDPADPDAVTHAIGALSAGEQQLLLLSVELERRWLPGSLILIDEPELHLDTRAQAALFDALTQLHSERGGQLVFATQSPTLLELAGPNRRVILGA